MRIEPLSDVEDTAGVPHSSWTAQALDLFISILKNVKKTNFSNQREMLEIIAIKMSERSYMFSLDQIERKYNSLEKMYTEKREKNQSVEPELLKLFGDCNSKSPVRQQQEQPPQKKIRLDTTDDSAPTADKSIELSTEGSEEKKILWSTEATKMFLELLEQLRPQLGSKLRTKKLMWEEICRQLGTHGFNFTYPQVENKWKSMLRHYRVRLELMLNGSPHHGAWPELVLKTAKYMREAESSISFAKDQKLPHNHDRYMDEEAIHFEEACALPDGEAISDDIDPVMIDDDIKPSNQELKEQSAKLTESNQNHLEQTIPQLDQIVKEIAGFREDNKTHQSELLVIKKLELQAYKDRTAQFTKMGNELSALVGYLKRGDVNL